MYFESPVSLNFFILCLFLLNGSKVLYVNPGCFKCIYGIKLIYYCIHFILLKQRISIKKGKSIKIGIFTPAKLLNNPLASCLLGNFNFLLLHT